jgi:hypothetical protein
MLRLVNRRLRERRRIGDRLPIRQRRLIVAERKALGDLHIGRERRTDRVVIRPGLRRDDAPDGAFDRDLPPRVGVRETAAVSAK